MSLKAYVFPGQGAQFVGMGQDLYNDRPKLRPMFEKANQILGFDITQLMLEGSIEDLTRTDVTQPAVFIHSVLSAQSLSDFRPDMVAGHSLGEFSALVAAKALSFEEGLKLVSIRAKAMHQACLLVESTMAAVLGMDDDAVDSICKSITEEVVVAANFNSPGQVVISGSIAGINLATEALKNAGAKRVLPIKVGGAFHSPLMKPAQDQLEEAILNCDFDTPICPIYQNFTASPATDPEIIKKNLINQLTGPVRWTATIQKMIADGTTHFFEIGPGNVLTGLIKKIAPDVAADKL